MTLPPNWDPKLEPMLPDIAALYRHLPQLVADGHEGKSVLCVGGQLQGVYDTQDEAYEAGIHMVGPGKYFLAQPIDRRDIAGLAPLFREPAAVPA